MRRQLSFMFSLCFVVLCQALTMHNSLSYRRLTTQDGLPQVQCERLWQDSRGYIYIGTLSGFVRYDGRSLTPFLRGRRENIVDFTEVDGEVFALNFRRQWLVDRYEVKMEQVDPERNLLLNNLNALQLPDGFVLLEDEQEEERRLCILESARLEPLSNATVVLADSVLDWMTPDRKLCLDTTGIYVPTPRGLFRFPSLSQLQGGAMASAQTICTRSDIFSLCRSGDVLYAFGSDSIFAIVCEALVPLVAYPKPVVPDYGFVVRPMVTHGVHPAVHGLIEGGVVFADAHSVYCTDGRTVLCLSSGANLIRDVLVDCWGRLWVATYEGVYCFFYCHFTNYTFSGDCDDGLQPNNDVVRSVAVDADGRLIMGTLDGRLLIDGRETAQLRDNYFLPSAARMGNDIYLPTRSDVARLDGEGLRWLHLPTDRYQFVAEAGDHLVVGTRNALLTYNPTNGCIDTLTSGIPHPWCAAVDGDGVLWVGSSIGLSRHEGHESTMLDYEGRKLVVTTLARTSAGEILFASTDSLYRLHDGVATSLNDQIPQIAGHEVRALHVTQRGHLIIAVIDGLYVCRIGDGGRLTDICWFDHHNGFTLIEPQMATMAESPDGTVYLLGVEGTTSFDPEALLSDSQADTVITPPLEWWQRWWAMLLFIVFFLAVLTAVVAFVVHRYNSRRLRHLRRETRQKGLQISAIRLKAIPHFHSNVLAGIEYFLMNGSTDDAIHYLKLYSDFTNQTLADIDRPSRSVAEEVEFARIYLQLEGLRFGQRLTYDIRVDDDVNSKTQIPNMLIYTYAQNAVKHGITPKSEGGCVLIRVRQVGGETIVAVEDNGIGREAAANFNTHSTKQGLRILMEQVTLYNQTNSRHIRQQITDLHDDQGRAIGTRFEMSVPLGFKFE